MSNIKVYGIHCTIPYPSPYKPAHFPKALLPEIEEGKTYDPPDTAPREYNEHKDRHAYGVALSIDPHETRPLNIVRTYVEELKAALAKKFQCSPPTLYATLLPPVPQNNVRRRLSTINSSYFRRDWIDWSRRFSHPGIALVDVPVTDNNPDGKLFHVISTLRDDRTWQAVIMLDPIPFANEAWIPEFQEHCLHVFAQGEPIRIRYLDLHDTCPLIGGLIDPGFVGCIACPHNDIYCRASFLQQILEKRSPTALPETLWLRAGTIDCVLSSFSPARIEHWTVSDHEKLVKSIRTDYVGWASKDAAVKDRHGPNYIAAAPVDRLTLGFNHIQKARETHRLSAARATDTRQRHDKICGTGSEACALREEGCNQWRRYKACSGRRSMLDTLEEELHTNFQVASRKIPVRSLQLHTWICDRGFQYGTKAGQLRQAFFCGVQRHALEDSVERWEICVGDPAEGDTMVFPSWLKMKQWVRRKAPWALSYMEAAEEHSSSVEITEELRALFRLSQTIRWLSTSSGWGSTSHEVLSYPIGPTEKPRYVVMDTHRYVSTKITSAWSYWRMFGFTGAGGLLPP